jgi:hypothetical protein
VLDKIDRRDIAEGADGLAGSLALMMRCNSLFFLQSGMVSGQLPSGVRLASLGPGMEFGEMAIIEQHRSADVWADTAMKCLELPLDSFRRLSPAPPADRAEDHAKSIGPASAAPDPCECQGRSAQRVFTFGLVVTGPDVDAGRDFDLGIDLKM